MKLILVLAMSVAFAQNKKRNNTAAVKPAPAAPVVAAPARTYAINCAFGYQGRQLQGMLDHWQQASTAGIVIGDFSASVARARDAIMNGDMDTLSTPGSVVVILKNSKIAHIESLDNRGVCVVLEGDVQQASNPLRRPG